MNTTLVPSARRYFGRWRTALIAAGLPAAAIPKPRTRWTKQSLIRQIQERYELGLPMTASDNSFLAAAALPRFGDWRQALRAAGLKPTRKRQWWKQSQNVLENNERDRKSGPKNS